MEAPTNKSMKVETASTDVFPTPDKPSVSLHLHHLVENWDPLLSADWKRQNISTAAIIRVKKDIKEIYNEPPSGILILPDDDDISLVYAMITGLFDTPYEGGFFLFVIRFPPQYPISPPRVRLLTTDNNRVRFNPVLYKSGKVCLSTIGTWSGPGWSPAHTLSSVLISIQSLMNDKPYHNEPGFAQERNSGDCKRYNDCIEHETIRVAVCGLIEGECPLCPNHFINIAKSFFLEYYDHYVAVCKEKMHLDGRKMTDPFGAERGKFIYKDLLVRLEKLKKKAFNEQEIIPPPTE